MNARAKGPKRPHEIRAEIKQRAMGRRARGLARADCARVRWLLWNGLSPAELSGSIEEIAEVWQDAGVLDAEGVVLS